MITRTCDGCGATIPNELDNYGPLWDEINITYGRHPWPDTGVTSFLSERKEFCLTCGPVFWKKVQDALEK